MNRVRVRMVPEFPNLVISEDGCIQGPSGRWLRLFPDRRGYLRFNVYQPNRTWKQYGVHAAVCIAFHGPRPDGLLIRHLDGNPQNNHATNLAWGTHLENEADKARHGMRLLGTRHPQAKLSDDDVWAIRSDRSAGMLLAEIVKKYGVSLSHASRITRGESWGHI